MLVRRHILRSIMFITLNPFFQVIFSNLKGFIPDKLVERQRSLVMQVQLSHYKNDLLILLNNISIKRFGQRLFEYLKILNFLLKKPAGVLILELLNEDNKKNDKQSENQNKMLDMMQQQFALSFSQRSSSSSRLQSNASFEQGDTAFQEFNQELYNHQSIFSQLYSITYGVLTEMIMKNFDMSLPIKFLEEALKDISVDQMVDLFMSLLVEILIKLQILIINHEQTILDNQQNPKLNASYR